ncbi:hypothetical protein QE152_g10727 [Popillia japonica]|uniref:Amyloid protein-binding protein 2 n=1 Tax=Popillia japonica TaxID=7064 RepID=A0AAW1LQF0_POPJA
MSSDQFPSLYCLCLKIAVVDCANSCKFCKKEFRLLPDNVLFDFYNKMCLEKRLCLLGLEFSNLDVFKRMLRIKHKRRELLKMFQILTVHCSNVTELVSNYLKYINFDEPSVEMIDFGLRLGGFFKEGGWYLSSIQILKAVEDLCKKMECSVPLLLKLLDCYYKRIYVECYYCITNAEETMNSMLLVLKQLEQQNAVPNLSGVYANFATMYFLKSEYEQAYNWSQKALRLLNEDLPKRIIIDVLSQASKSCVVKRHFAQAELLIKQAMSLASQAYVIDKHPRYSDTLMDYGFFLLNSDFIQESVKVYERALSIRKEVFEKYNILVAIGHEDLAYAQYVNEYSSGQFYSPRIIIDVLSQASKSCVVKRHFAQAELLIKQAMSLASQAYVIDKHPRYSDTLMDYGFFLLNSDFIQESVKVYERALSIRKEVFEKYNILVAIGHEDLAYAQYVNEYSSGQFYSPRENAERAMRIMEKLLPRDHLLLASAKRVKALILEEIALDMREASSHQAQTDYLKESESLHQAALEISRRSFGERNVQTAKHYGNLGRLYQTMTQYKEAEQMHLKAISIKEELLGPNDYEVGLSVGHLASLYNYHMKRYHDAEKLYLRSIDISLRLFGDAYSGLEYDYRGIIHVYTELDDFDNMAIYSIKMREWRERRETQKTFKYPDKPENLTIVISKFFDLC